MRTFAFFALLRILNALLEQAPQSDQLWAVHQGGADTSRHAAELVRKLGAVPATATAWQQQKERTRRVCVCVCLCEHVCVCVNVCMSTIPVIHAWQLGELTGHDMSKYSLLRRENRDLVGMEG